MSQLCKMIEPANMNDSFQVHGKSGQVPVSSSLANAVDLFVMRKFEKCFQACCDVVQTAKCEPEQERNDELIEAAAALGIQALAEMDKWQEAVSFITQVYGAVHLCSSKILQVCILLHAHVEEYLPCHRLLQTWLHHEDNARSKQCVQVVRLYACHILLPTGQFGFMEEIINMCPVLSEEEKQNLRELPETGRYEEAKSSALQPSSTLENQILSPEAEQDQASMLESSIFGDHKEEATIKKISECPCEQDPESHTQDKPGVLSLCKKLYTFLIGKLGARWRHRFIVVVLSFLTLWALIQAQTGDPVSSISRLVTLGQGLIHRLKLLTQR